MIMHTNFEDTLMGESIAEVRAHWPDDGITLDVKKVLKARGIDLDE
mgnify:CR=1 FL=1